MNLLIQVPEEKAVMDATLNLMNLCNLMALCLLTASMCHFLVKCMEKGMIFRGYYNWITYWLWLSKKKIKKDVRIKYCPRNLMEPVHKISDVITINSPIFKSNKYQWLWKPLGGCIYCFSVYIYIITFLIIGKHVLVGNFLIWAVWGILGIGLNYFWIEVIQRIKI